MTELSIHESALLSSRFQGLASQGKLIDSPSKLLDIVHEVLDSAAELFDQDQAQQYFKERQKGGIVHVNDTGAILSEVKRDYKEMMASPSLREDQVLKHMDEEHEDMDEVLSDQELVEQCCDMGVLLPEVLGGQAVEEPVDLTSSALVNMKSKSLNGSSILSGVQSQSFHVTSVSVESPDELLERERIAKAQMKANLLEQLTLSTKESLEDDQITHTEDLQRLSFTKPKEINHHPSSNTAELERTILLKSKPSMILGRSERMGRSVLGARGNADGGAGRPFETRIVKSRSVSPESVDASTFDIRQHFMSGYPSTGPRRQQRRKVSSAFGALLQESTSQRSQKAAGARTIVSSGATSTLAGSLRAQVILSRRRKKRLMKPIPVPLPIPRFYEERKKAQQGPSAQEKYWNEYKSRLQGGGGSKSPDLSNNAEGNLSSRQGDEAGVVLTRVSVRDNLLGARPDSEFLSPMRCRFADLENRDAKGDQCVVTNGARLPVQDYGLPAEIEDDQPSNTKQKDETTKDLKHHQYSLRAYLENVRVQTEHMPYGAGKIPQHHLQQSPYRRDEPTLSQQRVTIGTPPALVSAPNSRPSTREMRRGRSDVGPGPDYCQDEGSGDLPEGSASIVLASGLMNSEVVDFRDPQTQDKHIALYPSGDTRKMSKRLPPMLNHRHLQAVDNATRTVKEILANDRKLHDPKTKAAPVALSRLLSAIDDESHLWERVNENDKKIAAQKVSPYLRGDSTNKKSRPSSRLSHREMK